MWWFDTHIFCETIAIIGLVNTSITSHNSHCVCVVRTFTIYSPSNLQVYNKILLTIVTKLYIASPGFIYFISRSLYLLTTVKSFPYPLLHPLPSLFPGGPVNVAQKQKAKGEETRAWSLRSKHLRGDRASRHVCPHTEPTEQTPSRV